MALCFGRLLLRSGDPGFNTRSDQFSASDLLGFIKGRCHAILSQTSKTPKDVFASMKTKKY